MKEAVEAAVEVAFRLGVSIVKQLIPIHALLLAASTFALAERRPEVRPQAEQRLRWVVEGFAL